MELVHRTVARTDIAKGVPMPYREKPRHAESELKRRLALTPRQAEILVHWRRGLNLSAIARVMGIAGSGTVRTILDTALDKEARFGRL